MKFKKLFTTIILATAGAMAAQGAASLPYHNPCSDISSVTKLSETERPVASAWQQYSYPSGTVFRCKNSSSDGQGIGTVWTPELDLKVGKSYKVTVVMGVERPADSCRGEVALYASPSIDAAQTVLIKQDPAKAFSTSSTTYPEAVVGYFTYQGGKPYIGIGRRGYGSIGYFIVADILVEEFEGELPVEDPANFTATSSGKTVSLSWTLPSKDVGGAPVASIDRVSLTRDGFIVNEWTSRTPGEKMEYTDHVSAFGANRYILTCETSGKQSSAILTVDVTGGASVPSVCTSYEKDADGNYIGKNYYASATYVPGNGISIKWYPYTGMPAGTAPVYKVVRIGDGKVIGEGITATTATDTDLKAGDDVTLYQYGILVNDGTAEKTLYTSSVVSLNNTMPFVPAVTADALYEFTLIDADRDTYNWIAVSGVGAIHGVSRSFNVSRRGDDWMITPGLKVEKGKTYRIDIDAFCASIAESVVEMEVKAGLANTIEAMTSEVVPDIIFTHLTPRTYSGYYNADEAGNLFVGIRSKDPNGQNKFNDLGVSRIAVYEVSTDIPVAIADLKVKYSATPGLANLEFTAPSKSIAGGTLAKVDRIEIEKNGEPFKTLTDVPAGEACSVPIELELGTQDVYTLTPYSAGGAGLSVTINVMVVEPPYTNEFLSEDDATGFTVINPDLSGYSWGYYNNTMRLYKGFSYNADDYLVSPPIHLEKGNFYKIDFTTWLDKEDTDYIYDNRIEVLLGTAPTLEALTDTVVKPFYVRGASTSKSLAKDWFTVPETGEYYLAWHATCAPVGSREIYIDDINIGEKIPDIYPAGVDNLVITPDPDGKLTATVSFDLPDKDLAGRPLDASNLYEYRVYCDGMMITNDLTAAPGQHVDYTHSTTLGIHLYTVRCFGAEDEPTRDVETLAYVGVNRPGAVPFVDLTEDPEKYGTITLTWDVPETDVDGFPLNTKDITYTLGQYYTDMYTGQSQEIEFANNVKALSYTRNVKTGTDTQEFMRFYVRANTSAGKGNPTVLTKWNAVGKPFDLPFTESFANGAPKYNMMQERPFEGKFSSWGYNNYNPVTGVQPVDGDKGLAMMEVGESGSGARLFTLRINLNKEKPVMTFYVYSQTNETRIDENILGISVREGNGEFVTVDQKSVDEWAGGHPGWQKASVDLSPWAGKVVYIGLDAIAKNLTFTHIDNIVISEPAPVDLTLRSVSHDKVYVGVEHNVYVTVANHGSQAVEGATVDVMLDGASLKTLDVGKIEAGEEKVLSFTHLMSRQDLGNHAYSARLTADGDADPLDNEAQGDPFYLGDNKYPMVTALEGMVEEKTVTLTWETPELPSEPEEITDDFESYPSWSTMATGGIGDYTLYDRDKCAIGGFEGHNFPNIQFGSKQSFTLWDFSDPYFAFEQSQSDRYKAHSGDKCLVSIYAPGADDWTEDQIVSPLLPGHAQTIKFWAKALDDTAPEIFQVYYSFTGKNLADYIDNRFPRVTADGTWREYTYDLPEGTKYFVIEHYSNRYTGGFFFFLDDLTYTPVGNETLELKGYNIYRNGNKATDSPVVEPTWTDNYNERIKTYGVTAVYDRGESGAIEIEAPKPQPKDPVDPDNPDVGGVDNAYTTVKVYARAGEIVISGAEGMDIAVANTAGMWLTNRKGDEITRIPVAPGVYIVNVAGKSVKLIVK